MRLPGFETWGGAFMFDDMGDAYLRFLLLFLAAF
jgi:hypothetical protein